MSTKVSKLMMTAAANIAPPALSVARALDEYIATTDEVRSWDGKYHPSSLWACTRKVIYNVRGTETTEETDNQAKRRFYIGHRLHEVVQQAIDVSPDVQGFWPEFEVDVPELNLTGHSDGLIKFTDGTYALLEIKSIRKAGFKFGLREENLSQAKTYAFVAREHGARALNGFTGIYEDIPALGDALRGVLLVYVEKEDLEIREYWIPWEASFVTDIQNRLVLLDSYRAAPQSLPPRIPKNKDGALNWQCRYCPFMTKCWKQDPDEIKPGEEEVPF